MLVLEGIIRPELFQQGQHLRLGEGIVIHLNAVVEGPVVGEDESGDPPDVRDVVGVNGQVHFPEGGDFREIPQIRQEVIENLKHRIINSDLQQCFRYWSEQESERVIVPVMPGNDGGGRDPYFWRAFEGNEMR
jgi:hypothetical protein